MKFYHSSAPIAKKRPRVCKNMTYDEQHKEKRALKFDFASQFRSQGYLNPLEGPIYAKMVFLCPIPSSWSKKRQKAFNGQYVTTRPDVDNFIKFYLDVLNGIAYQDDSQISVIFSQKKYSDKPCVIINLYKLEDNMINEHALTYTDKLTIADISYLAKKANKLGNSNRIIVDVYQEEDNEGIHIYFKVTGMN